MAVLLGGARDFKPGFPESRLVAGPVSQWYSVPQGRGDWAL